MLPARVLAVAFMCCSALEGGLEIISNAVERIARAVECKLISQYLI